MFNFDRKKPILFALDTVVMLAVAATLIGSFVRYQQHLRAEADVCRAPGKNYDLTLQNDSFSQKQLSVHLCDTLTIINKDDKPYSLNFGEHDSHIAYPGYTAQVQVKDETVVIDALQKGTYELHEHIRDKAVLKLTVGDKQ
jgi:hypothetical protein